MHPLLTEALCIKYLCNQQRLVRWMPQYLLEAYHVECLRIYYVYTQWPHTSSTQECAKRLLSALQMNTSYVWYMLISLDNSWRICTLYAELQIFYISSDFECAKYTHTYEYWRLTCGSSCKGLMCSTLHVRDGPTSHPAICRQCLRTLCMMRHVVCIIAVTHVWFMYIALRH
jgi:hypothetical protein